MTDEALLRLAYREHQGTPLILELALRLDTANDKLAIFETQTAGDET